MLSCVEYICQSTQQMLTSANIGQLNVTPCALASRLITIEIINKVLDQNTGELMEYRHLMKNPKYQQLWGTLYINELGRLSQGMPVWVDGTNTILIVNKEEIPAA